MTYNLKSIKAPRMAGKFLQLFTFILENDYLNWTIIPKLLTDSGISAFRKLDIKETPTLYPLIEPKKSKKTKASNSSELINSIEEAPKSISKAGSFLSIDDYATTYRDGTKTPEEVADKIISLMKQSDEAKPPLRAIINWQENDIMEQAKASSKRIKEGKPLSILDGVPIAIKDEVDQTPYGTTVGTSFLGKMPAVKDATAVARLRAAGALLIGKANMHEIGIGVTGFNPHHGAARNPYNPEHYTGGSSSGPAAAVAAGLCPMSLGADGGGSIRIPSAFCGMVGLKATYGRVSEFGAAPLCWSVAHIGPIANSAKDVAIGYAVMAGADVNDTHTLHQPPVSLDNFNSEKLKGFTFGIYKPWFEHAQPIVVERCNEGVKALKDLGATIIDIEIPHLEEFRVAHVITIVSEMAAAMEPYYEKHLTQFGLDVRINLAIGRQLTNRDYILAQRVRTLAIEQFKDIFQKVDGIITPTTGCPSPKIPADAFPNGDSNLNVLSEIMRFAPIPNLTGAPAISIPVGYTNEGLPIGMQVIGKHWQEDLLLRIANALNPVFPKQKPKVIYNPLS